MPRFLAGAGEEDVEQVGKNELDNNQRGKTGHLVPVESPIGVEEQLQGRLHPVWLAKFPFQLERRGGR